MKPFKFSRTEGKDNFNTNNLVRTKDEKGKTVYRQNFINYSINDYKLSENGTYQDIVNRQLLNRNLQDGESESNIDL